MKFQVMTAVALLTFCMGAKAQVMDCALFVGPSTAEQESKSAEAVKLKADNDWTVSQVKVKQATLQAFKSKDGINLTITYGPTLVESKLILGASTKSNQIDGFTFADGQAISYTCFMK